MGQDYSGFTNSTCLVLRPFCRALAVVSLDKKFQCLRHCVELAYASVVITANERRCLLLRCQRLKWLGGMDILTDRPCRNESALDVLSRAALMLECNSSSTASHQQQQPPGNTIHYLSGLVTCAAATRPRSLAPGNGSQLMILRLTHNALC